MYELVPVFLRPLYHASSDTHGVSYEQGRLVAPDMNLFNTQTRKAKRDNEAHMMRPGYPAQNWCLEVEWESEAIRPAKGFAKVAELFTFVGGNNTRIEEIWLLV